MSYGNTINRFGIISEDIIQDILDEANHAHEKHGTHSMLYGDDNKSLRILVEEVGEVSREMNELALGNRTDVEYEDKLYEELVQNAAMAITWMQKIMARKIAKGYRT